MKGEILYVGLTYPRMVCCFEEKYSSFKIRYHLLMNVVVAVI